MFGVTVDYLCFSKKTGNRGTVSRAHWKDNDIFLGALLKLNFMVKLDLGKLLLYVNPSPLQKNPSKHTTLTIGTPNVKTFIFFFKLR